MPQANLEILIRSRDEASKTLAQINAAVEKSGAELRKAGMSAVGAGAAIFGALAYAAKGAAEEQAGIERLRGSMANVGLSYDLASGSLEKWITAQMKSTAFADDEQRSALSQLVAVTRDLSTAQGLLTTAMDLSRFKQIDLATSADLLVKVYSGNTGMLSLYGIVIKDGATATEAFAQIQSMAGGQAQRFGQTVSGQMAILKNNFDDLREAIGAQLLPTIQAVIRPVSEFVARLSETNPQMLRFLTTAGLVTAAVSLLGGGFLLTLGYLPKLVAGYQSLITVMNTAKVASIGLNAALGPVGWIAIAAMAIGTTAALAYGFNQLTSSVDSTNAAIARTSDTVTALDPAWQHYFATLDKGTKTTQAQNQALDAQAQKLEATKVALAIAMYTVDGYTYRASLFTEAEIKAAQASGKKVERLKQQSDTMYGSIGAVDGLTASMLGFNKAETEAGSQAEQTDVTVAALLEGLRGTAFGASTMFGALMNAVHNSGVDTMTLIENYLSEWATSTGASTDRTKQGLLEVLAQIQALPSEKQITILLNYVTTGSVPSTTTTTPSTPVNPDTGMPINPGGIGSSPPTEYALGGVVRETGLAMVHKGETVFPSGTPIIVEAHMTLEMDGERIANKIFRIAAKQARLRGYGTNG